MKKIIILLLLLLTGCGMTGMIPIEFEEPIKSCQPNITIASFNIRKFSDNSRSDEELAQIAEVLSNYDLIAVQEVLGDPVILNRTMELLPGYNFIVSEEVGNVQKERYAFIFNEKIKVTSEGKTYYDKYDKFIREPYYASFKAGEFDFTIMTVHILYGKSASDRTGEMKQIASVYEYYQEKDSENDLILTGDFNTQPTQDNFDFIWAIPDVRVAIQEGKSTLGKTGNLYDNIIFMNSHTDEYTRSSGIHYFDAGMDMDEAKEAISDHRPVWAVFCTGVDDD
jgi:endonuclease/exonuclease/phosphatase family metal-dependent hydrolase